MTVNPSKTDMRTVHMLMYTHSFHLTHDTPVHKSKLLGIVVAVLALLLLLKQSTKALKAGIILPTSWHNTVMVDSRQQSSSVPRPLACFHGEPETLVTVISRYGRSLNHTCLGSIHTCGSACWGQASPDLSHLALLDRSPIATTSAAESAAMTASHPCLEPSSESWR